jgi:hypothetical protein
LAKPAQDAKRKPPPLGAALFALTELACEAEGNAPQLRASYEQHAESLKRAQAALWLGVERALREGTPWLERFASLRGLPQETSRALLAELEYARRTQLFELTPPRQRNALKLIDSPARRAARVRAALLKACAALELSALCSWLSERAALEELTRNLGELLAQLGLGTPRGTHRADADASLAELLRAQPPQSGPVSRPAPAPSAAERPLHADDLSFTVFRPRQLLADEWTRLLAFAHLSEKRPDAPADEPEPLARVRAQAHALLGAAAESYREAREDSALAIPFEGQLTLVPHVPGVEFDPPQHSFRWLTDLHRVEFLIRAQRKLAGTSARGSLSVYYGSILVADLTLSFPVVRQRQPLTGGDPVGQSARMYRKIFASYSHRDVHTVSMFAKLVRAFGDDYLIDQDKLRAGQCWSEALRAMIREADVFQLFWSSHSMHSPFVRQEWEYALSLGKPNFVRPTYWETPLPEAPDLPPAELKRLHFQQIPQFAWQDALAKDPPSARFNAAASVAVSSASARTDTSLALPTRSAAPRKPWLGPGVGALVILLVGVLSARRVSEVATTVEPTPNVVAPPEPALPEPPPDTSATTTPTQPMSPALGPPPKKRPASAYVEVVSQPAGARVYLDGKFLGLTPLPILRAEARGELVLKLRGHQAAGLRLEPRTTDEAQIRLTLAAPRPAAPPPNRDNARRDNARVPPPATIDAF